MQNSSKRHRWGVTASMLCALMASTPIASMAQPRDHVSLAQELLRAAFPDLPGDISVTLHPQPSDDWRMVPVMTLAVRTFETSAPDHSRVVLSVTMQATNGVLTSANFFDENMHTDRVRLFRTASNKGGDVASNVLSELRMRGAKHIPSAVDDFLADLNVNRFSPVIGQIQNVRARFQGVPPIPVGPEVEFWPTWIVDITTVQAGASRCYAMLVDPITLKPTGIMQADCNTR